MVSVLGAILAVYWNQYSENRRGELTYRELQNFVNSYRGLVEDTQAKLAELILVSSQLGAWNSAHAALNRIQWLLQRVIFLFHRRMQVHSINSQLGNQIDSSALTMDNYYDATLLQQPINLAGVDMDEKLTPLVDRAVKDWTSRWKNFCESHDFHTKGHFPGLELDLQLAQFIHRFHLQIIAEYSNAAVAHWSGKSSFQLVYESKIHCQLE